jgi:hypothetical protein
MRATVLAVGAAAVVALAAIACLVSNSQGGQNGRAALATSEFSTGFPLWDQYNNSATDPPADINSQDFERTLGASDDQAADDFVFIYPFNNCITGVRVLGDATMGAVPVKIGQWKTLLKYLPRLSKNIRRAMKGAKKETKPLWNLGYGWSRVARNPQVLKLFASAIVSAALFIGAVSVVHLLISLIRKRRTRVFISFQHEREPIADMLANEMTKCGIRAEKLPFKENPDSDMLLLQVRQQIRDCDIFVCVPGNRPSFVESEVLAASVVYKPIVFVLIEAEAPQLPNTAMKGYPVFALERLQRFHRKGFRILASFCSYLAADWRSTIRVYGAVFNHLLASTGLVFAVFLTSTGISTVFMGSSRAPDVAAPPVGFLPTAVSNPVFLASFVSPLILFLIPYSLFFMTRWKKRAQIRNMTCGQKFKDSSIPRTLSSSLTRAHLLKILYRGDIVAHHESAQA